MNNRSQKAKLFALLFTHLFGLAFTAIQAQTIGGRILDATTLEPLIGASIYWASTPQQGTFTTDEGTFNIVRSQPTDSLHIGYLGYQEHIIAVAPEDTFLQILLLPAITEAATITVVAERMPARVFATENLSRLDVYLNPAAKADVLLAINSLPAATNGDETANVSLRGSPSEATGIFLNNVPLYDVVRLDQPNGIGQFSIFNTAIITELEVYPSNPPLYLGQATGGAVSIRTEDQIIGRQTAVNLHLAGGGLQWQQSMGEQSGLLAYVNYGNHQLLKGANPEALVAIDGFRSLDAGLYFTHQWNQNTQLQAFNFTLAERYNYQLRSGRFEGLFQQQKNRNLTIINLAHQRQNWRLEWNQGFNLSSADYRLGNIQSQLDQLNYHGNLLLHGQLQNWNGTASISYSSRRQTTGGTYPLYTGAWEVDDPWAAYAIDQSTDLPEVATFIKRALGKSTIGIGTRLGAALNSPSLAWAAQVHWYRPLGPQHSLTLAGGRYYQPDGAAPATVAANYNRSYQIAADWQWRPGRWQVKAAIYQHWAQWQGRENPIYGAELSVRYQTYPFSFWGSLSHISSNWQDATMRYPTDHDFHYFARAGLQCQLPAEITFSANFIARQGRYVLPLVDRQWEPAINNYLPIFAPPHQGQRLTAYQRLDVGLSRIFLLGEGALITYLNINNALDQQNVQQYIFNHDYSQQQPNFYSGFIWFTGVVWQW